MSAYDLDQHEQVDTVKVKSDLFDSGYVTINVADFNDEVHELYDMEDLHDQAAAEAAVAPKRRKK